MGLVGLMGLMGLMGGMGIRDGKRGDRIFTRLGKMFFRTGEEKFPGREEKRGKKIRKGQAKQVVHFIAYPFLIILEEEEDYLKFLASIVQPGKSFRSACKKMGAFSLRPFSCQSSQRMTIWAKAPP